MKATRERKVIKDEKKYRKRRYIESKISRICEKSEGAKDKERRRKSKAEGKIQELERRIKKEE